MSIAESRPPILVVEDESVVATSLVSSLAKLGYPLAGVAATGEEAVALAGTMGPGLVLMDIHLRGHMDGIHAAQQIQEKLFIPVVYLTACSDEPTLERARVTQPFGYVLKPYEDREIEVAIQIAIFRHQMERALRENEKRLDAILCSIDDAVVATDTRKRITFLNRAAETLLAWTSDLARGRLISDVIKTESPGRLPLRLCRVDHDAIPIELVESPVMNASGAPTGYVTIIRNISERLHAQESHERELVERAARAAAEKEHERARLKSEISLALADITQLADHTTALRKVANLVASSLATCCIVHVEDRAHEIRVAARSERPQADGDLALFDEVVPQLENPTSAIGVPLRARQRVIGSLTIFSTEANRGYDPSDQSFVQEIADRVALAIDNGRLYVEVQEAKTAAERLYEAEQRARAEAEAMFRIAEALSEAQLDLDAVVQRVTNEATMLVGAKFGAFFYNLLDGYAGAAAPYTLSGVSRGAFERLGLSRNTVLLDATFIGQIVRLDDVEQDQRYSADPPERPLGAMPLASYLAVPVVSRTGHVIGGLFFGHSDVAQFTEQHERMAKALATHAAVAIDNARLFKATREAEERQGRLVQELERAVRFSETFVGILGHDLRNPLSGITTATSLAISRAESDRVSKPLERVLSSAERMSRMIDQILDFTRIRLGRELPLQRTAMDLETVCRLILDELEDATTATELRLDLRGDARGHWDADRLAQLVSNLAGNAVQHRQPGTPVVVTIDGTRPDEVRFEIQNVGVIPADVLPTIFEPLRSGSSRKREGASGLGLGLYISQEIAVAHGGAIRVVSDARGGTRFKVELPRKASDKDSGVFAHSVGTSRQTASRKRILIVEDDVDIRDTLRDAFEDEGYLVLCANNGREGLATLREIERPSVVVLDLMMPVMDGNELYEAMLADPDLSDIPVIVSTSDPSRAPSGVLLMKKPVNLKMMLKTIARFG